MDKQAKKIHIQGLVQGVGFRPFVAEWATSHGLSGYVKNEGGMVTALLLGEDSATELFISELNRLDGKGDILPGARVDKIDELPMDEEDDRFLMESTGGFSIIESTKRADVIRVLPYDIATCDKCQKELFDPENRRYRHPFISCTSCGPRYTIMSEVPYDRKRTTMRDFPLCHNCEMEYEGKAKKRGSSPVRHYAQTICCPDCGPVLKSKGADGEYEGEEALLKAMELLKQGGILALKDVGGYHLCFDAYNKEAAKRLRRWKDRDNKPFAIMFKSIDEIKKYARVLKTEEKLLLSPAAPIVLLKKKSEAENGMPLPYEVMKDSLRVGAFLPSNPLQHLILSEISPLIMTSGNRGNETIITDDDEMISLMESGLPDMVLYHDRQILMGLDDSIYQVTEIPNSKEVVQLIRRARGLVPSTIWLNRELPRDSFGAGGDLKSVFAIGRKNAVYLSGHFGDLLEAVNQRKRSHAIDHMEGLFGIDPGQCFCDSHPGYVSATDAKNRSDAGGADLVKIQHHFAHILSVAAEHDIRGQVLGAAFDGTGYGDDGTIWGGEFLLCDLSAMTYERVGHLESIPIMGGDISSKDAAKTAYCLIRKSLTKEEQVDVAKVLGISEAEKSLMDKASEMGLNTVPSSSMGRLFDGAAAILGICKKNTYEGECPIMLQYAAESYDPDLHGACPKLTLPISTEEKTFVAHQGLLLKGLYLKKKQGISPEALAYGFHEAVADMTVKICEMTRNREVVLSGGTMLNGLLLKMIISKLSDAGISPLLNKQVPPGDGGLALGQIFYGTKGDL